jgi:hypothetical protein
MLFGERYGGPVDGVMLPDVASPLRLRDSLEQLPGSFDVVAANQAGGCL